MYPACEGLWRAQSSAGNYQPALQAVGLDRLRQIVVEAVRQHTQPDGAIVLRNVYRWVVGHTSLNDNTKRMKICQASAPEQIALSRKLFEQYGGWLGMDLSFRGFVAELAGLPGDYASPHGRLLLAMPGDDAAGCAALRSLGKGICEMNRLFVRQQFRGRSVGNLLAARVVQEARAIGYRTMKLDTLPSMRAAIRLYDALGFRRCPPYYQTPIPDTVFMELQL